MCTSGNDRDIAVPWMSEAAVVTLYMIGEALEDVPFAYTSRARLRVRIPNHVDNRGADKFSEVHITEFLKIGVDRIHSFLPLAHVNPHWDCPETAV